MGYTLLTFSEYLVGCLLGYMAITYRDELCSF